MELSLAAEELHRRCPLAASSPIGPCARTCACIATHHVQQVRWHLQRSIRHSCHVFEGLHELGKGQRPGVCITSVPGDASTAWHCHSAYRLTKALDEFLADVHTPHPPHGSSERFACTSVSLALRETHQLCVCLPGVYNAGSLRNEAQRGREALHGPHAAEGEPARQGCTPCQSPQTLVATMLDNWLNRLALHETVRVPPPRHQVKAQATAAAAPAAQVAVAKYCESIHQTKRRPTRTIHVSRQGAGPLNQQQGSARRHRMPMRESHPNRGRVALAVLRRSARSRSAASTQWRCRL